MESRKLTISHKQSWRECGGGAHFVLRGWWEHRGRLWGEVTTEVNREEKHFVWEQNEE